MLGCVYERERERVAVKERDRKNQGLSKYNSRYDETPYESIAPFLQSKLSEFNKIMESYIHTTKCNKVRKNIAPGDNKSLWSAAKIA